ncbi:MAG: hypothetical protein HFI70_03800 [Lachnospiraceae bacterium]|nr:hypothetical protein [Lachnospiraceae bacterium]
MDNVIFRQEHEEFARRQDAENERQNRRISLLEERFQKLNTLTVAIEKMAINMENMLEEQKRQGVRLEALEKEPVENFNQVKQAIITTVIGVVAGGIATALLALL